MCDRIGPIVQLAKTNAVHIEFLNGYEPTTSEGGPRFGCTYVDTAGDAVNLSIYYPNEIERGNNLVKFGTLDCDKPGFHCEQLAEGDGAILLTTQPPGPPRVRYVEVSRGWAIDLTVNNNAAAADPDAVKAAAQRVLRGLH